MARLSKVLADTFPEVTDVHWNRWRSWFAKWRYEEDAILVILDPDGEVHLRLWKGAENERIFLAYLITDQFVFRVKIFQNLIERVRCDHGYLCLGAITELEGVWSARVTKTTFGVRCGSTDYSTWTWTDLGKLYQLAILSRAASLSRQDILPDMMRILLSPNNPVLVEHLTELHNRLCAEALQAREKDVLFLQDTSMLKLRAQKKLIEQLRQLSDDLDALPGANTTAMLAARLKVLRRLQDATCIEYDSPGYFDSVRNDCEQKIAKCERLIAAHTARNSRARK